MIRTQLYGRAVLCLLVVLSFYLHLSIYSFYGIKCINGNNISTASEIAIIGNVPTSLPIQSSSNHLIELQNGVMYDHSALDYLKEVINKTGFPELRGITIANRPKEEMLYANLSSSFYGLKYPVYVCEVGSAYGYSALVLLNGNPDSFYTGFDLDEGWGYKYFIPIHDKIISDRRLKVGQRIRWFYGRSNVTLRKYIQEIDHPQCDLMHVDGSHIYEDVLQDLELVQHIMNKSHHWVVMDDCNMYNTEYRHYGVYKALNDFMQQGRIKNFQYFSHIEPSKHDTSSFVCLFQYVFD